MKKIALTFTQWVIVALSAVIGVMAVALKLQSNALKSAKLKLLEKELDIAIAKDDENIAQKKKKLREAKKQ